MSYITPKALRLRREYLEERSSELLATWVNGNCTDVVTELRNEDDTYLWLKVASRLIMERSYEDYEKFARLAGM